MEVAITVVGALLIYAVYSRIRTGYFSYYELATGLPRNLSAVSLLFRLTIPFLVSMLLGLGLRLMGITVGSSVGFGMGALFVLMLVTPQVLNPGLVPPPVVEQGQTREVYGLYLILLVVCSVLTYAGMRVAGMAAASWIQALVPSMRGLVDSVWAGLVIVGCAYVLNRLNQRLAGNGEAEAKQDSDETGSEAAAN